jgi:acyl-CoA reductase-like NAD-dependent aldehyde dehydrogenase
VAIYGISFLEWFAGEGRCVSVIRSGHQADKHIVVIKQQIGGIVRITRWNSRWPMKSARRAQRPSSGFTTPS